MTHSTAPLASPTTPEGATFRSVLAAPEEALIVVLVDSCRDDGFQSSLDACDQLRRSGVACKTVVFGESASASVAGRFETGETVFLEKWARPMLASVLSAADAVVALGRGAVDALGDYSESCRNLLLIIPPGVSDAAPVIGRVTLPWNGEDASDLFAKLRRELPVRSNAGSPPAVLPPIRKTAPVHAPKETPPSPAIARQPVSGGPSRSTSAVGSFVLYNDWGIGDELLLSGVAREVVRAHPGAKVWIRSRFGFRFKEYVRTDPVPADARTVETIYQNPTLYAPGAHSPFPGHLTQQMLDKFAIDTGLKIIAKDLRPELRLPAATAAAKDQPSVILHTRPNRRLSSKDWGLARWSRLSGLLHDAGIRVRQVGEKSEPLLEYAEDLRGVPPGELPGHFLRSSAVVCVVGFLMHLAEAVGVPAVVIYGGREHPAIDGYPDQTHLSSEPLPCRGRWGCHLGPDIECSHGMKCMELLTPELVSREVLSTLQTSQKGGPP